VTHSINPEISSVTGLRSGIAAFICGDSFSHGRSALGDPFGKAILLGFSCPEGVRVGWGVSEVLEAFVTTPATVYGNHDDRAVRLDRRCLQSRSWISAADSIQLARRGRVMVLTSPTLIGCAITYTAPPIMPSACMVRF